MRSPTENRDWYRNLILNGDCIDELRKLPNSIGTACITDPPYNYEFIGKNWSHDEIKRRLDNVADIKKTTLVKNIPYGSGLSGGVRNEKWYQKVHKNIVDYASWCKSWAEELYRVLKPGATVLVFNSTRTIAHVQVALEDVGFYARDILVYRRPSGIPKGANLSSQMSKIGHEDSHKWDGYHSALRGEWEAICVVQKPLNKNYLTTFLEHGTSVFNAKSESESFQSNILEGLYKKGQDERFDVHCTTKPLMLMEKLIEIFVPPTANALVLDPFAGTGTTLVAAKRRGIDYLGIELEPKYFEVIQRRLEEVQPK